MGWSQVVNKDYWNGTNPTPANQQAFGWSQSTSYFKQIFGAGGGGSGLWTPQGNANHNGAAGLKVSEYVYVNENIVYDVDGTIISSVPVDGKTTDMQPNHVFKSIGYYYKNPVTFKKNKSYQFNVTVTNYLQIGSQPGAMTPAYDGVDSYSTTVPDFVSPPLYLVTPLGKDKEVLTGKLNLWDNRQVGDSDTCLFPWPFFDTRSDVDLLDTSHSGRIFTLHYYSSTEEDVVSHLSQSPSIFYSNVLFGNRFLDLKGYYRAGPASSLSGNLQPITAFTPWNAKRNGKSTFNGEGIIRYIINETDWLIQGYSYASYFRGDSNGVQQFIPKPWREGGTLLGNGWYCYPNNVYIWYDRSKSTQTMWQSLSPYKVPQHDTESQFKNMPVGGPWSQSPDIDIPCMGDYYSVYPNSMPHPFTVDSKLSDKNRTDNFYYGSGGGSIMGGTVKTPHEGFRKNNYLARYVNMDKFNLSFKYRNTRGDNTGIKFFLSPTLPSQRPYNSFDKSSDPNPDKILTDWGTVVDKIYVGVNSGGGFNTSEIDSNPVILSDTLKEIRVTINMKHTWVGDLVINLKGPSGKIINLFNREKGNSDNFTGTTFTTDDTKPSIYYSSAPFNGTYKMKKDIGAGRKITVLGYTAYDWKSNVTDFKKLLFPSTTYNSQQYKNTVLGTWTLYIKDDASLDEGTLESWKIEFVYDSTSNTQYLGVLTQSTATQSHSFYGLQGNQYIVFVADAITPTSAADYTVVTLQDMLIEGSYHNLNNTLINVGASGSQPINFSLGTQQNPQNLFNPLSLIGENYSYNAYVGTGNTLNATSSLTYSVIRTKAGTGRFTSGIWEDGNWINGWRDSNIYEFFEVSLFISFNKNKKWRFSILGPSYYVSEFKVGEKIAVSNIVAIDINNERKFLKNYFTIIEKTVDNLILEFEYDFPLKRVERDSTNHRIIVTRNIWLNGNFYNGRFKGVWNDGNVISYPFLTKMEETHWIDGNFSGGHFKSDVISITYSSLSLNQSLVQINFGKTHSLYVGDQIYLSEYTDDTESVLFGDTIVSNVIDSKSVLTTIITNNDRTSQISQNLITGKVVTKNKTGLIQDINLNLLNVSKVVSSESMDDRSVFSYNTWMDLNYDKTSATNIFKPQTVIEPLTSTYFSQNNLYGYITTDILSSNSRFRDSFSKSIRQYKLGTKYKIYHDYIGESSYFDEYFTGNSQQFQNLGWKWNTAFNSSKLTFERTVETTDDSLINGKELKVSATYSGGVLNLQNPVEEVPDRYNEKINPNRYTMVSFDLISKDVFDEYFRPSGTNILESAQEQPMLHFGNLNVIDRKLPLSDIGVSLNYKVAPTYLPIYKNINHVFTPNKTKVEYFYNKRELMMTFRGSGEDGSQMSSYIIDNLKLYEIDMVPFFQYFTYENINRTVYIPLEPRRETKLKVETPYLFIKNTFSKDVIIPKSATDTINPDNPINNPNTQSF